MQCWIVFKCIYVCLKVSVVTNDEYPYDNSLTFDLVIPACKTEKITGRGVKVDRFYKVPPKDPEQLKASILQYGPVVIYVNTGNKIWQFHKG